MKNIGPSFFFNGDIQCVVPVEIADDGTISLQKSPDTPSQIPVGFRCYNQTALLVYHYHRVRSGTVAGAVSYKTIIRVMIVGPSQNRRQIMQGLETQDKFLVSKCRLRPRIEALHLHFLGNLFLRFCLEAEF
jgi:hypothetical protein